MTRSNDPQAADLAQLARISLDTNHPICQVCGQALHEGDNITAYAYRAAGEPAYAIGYIMCGSDSHEHPTVFTRGVREYVLTGHIGTCSNTRAQSTTFVLLNPTAVVTSPTTTAEPHVHPDAPTPRSPTQPTQQEPTPLLTAVREHARSDGGSLHEGSE
ncbi:hypothetical protein PM035_15755 [Halorubrum ezzemoulense]|uniref:hypothetical protein n=1 Tax=Halorubrum ezzemoulense TaxID=337243 RepID=UPI00232AD5EF|nr:hypothetical protein [Halorubrum ezzemoulense]MDB2262384.1 hypothetical protein [Halorubrum ezzemoulense]MDB2269121.1 hypothetical protein [Halorubrum ezzemoulense]